MIKIISGWTNPGGSTTAFVNLVNFFNNNKLDTELYGPHDWHLNKCKGKLLNEFSLDINDSLIIHFFETNWEQRPPIKGKLIYSCHEKDVRPIKSFNYSIFDKIHYVSGPQKEWHGVEHPYFICPNITENLTPKKKNLKDKIAGIIGSVDENKQTHISIQKALEDGCKKVLIFGKITDINYWNGFVKKLVEENKEVFFLGYTDNKQRIYDSISDVYLSSKSETWNYIKKECEISDVNFHGPEFIKDNFKEDLTNEQILEVWRKELEL